MNANQYVVVNNPTKAKAILLLRVEVLKIVKTNDDDGHVVIWL